MRIRALLTIGLAVSSLSAGCWYKKQQMYATVTNQSALKLRAVEVTYPGGTFGFPELKQGTSYRKWLAVVPPCTYSVKFETDSGQQFTSKPLDFGKDKCPSEVILTIDSALNVSGSAVAQ